MAFSSIEVTFNGVPQVDDVIGFSNNESSPIAAILEVFKTLRQASFQTTIGSNTSDSATRYGDAITLDFNSTSQYTISVASNVVTIEATIDDEIFAESDNNTSGRITSVITNLIAVPPFAITDVSYLDATVNPVCSHIKVQVTTNELAVKVTSPVTIDPNVINPFFFEWVRGDNIDITCEDGAAEEDTENVTLPQTLSVSNLTVDILNSPSGATVTITVTNVEGLTLQYSLDDITYQDENIYFGLAADDYTIFVQDDFGCTINDDFTVDEFTPDVTTTEAFFFISKAMSIRFKREVTWGDCTDYRNEENTLSCEYNALLPYREVQLFQTCDTITTQFKSNYETLAANVINSDGSKDALSITQITTNIDRKDKRDSTYYAINSEQTGIYFTTGDTYDYDTDVQNGTYALNGALPDWGIVGNFMFLDAIGWFTIVDIIFNDDVNADVLVIEYVYTGDPATIISSSNYNLFNYEVYEFDIDFSVYDLLEVSVEIINTDATFGTETYTSEIIEVAERWEDTLQILYYNPTNTDVFYSTGIQNKVRVGWEAFLANVDASAEGINTDTNSILLNSRIYETNILTLSPVTVGIMRQLTMALSHKELYLDEVKYRLSDDGLEVENFGQTNLQVITATLIKDGNVYNSEDEGNPESVQGTSDIEGLLQSDDDYLKV